MSDINDRLNGDDIEISRRDVKDRVTDIIYTNSEVADGEVLQYNSTTGLFSSVSPNAAGLYVEGGTDLPVTDGGTGASTASEARTNLGIGTIATQNANAVAITGGTISGLTTLGASAAAITGGTITGITDLAVADGGTGASTHTSGNVLLGNGTSAFTSTAKLNISQGGTDTASNTAYAVLCGGTTSTGAIQSISGLGSSGQWLTSNGTSALPTFQAALTGNINGRAVYLSSQTASSSAQIDFTGLSSTYIGYIVYFHTIRPQTDSTSLLVRVGTGETPTYDSGSNYTYTGWNSWEVGGLDAPGGSSGTTSISGTISRSLGTSTGEVCNGILKIWNPSDGTLYKTFELSLSYYNSSPELAQSKISGTYKSTTAVTAIRFLMSSGNIASGTFILYGILP